MTNKSRIFFLSQLLVIAVSISSAQAAPEKAPPGYSGAVGEFNQRRYPAAIEKLNGVLRSHPSHTMSHYYLALSYQATNQITSAQSEYNWVYENSTDPKIKYNSAVALNQIAQWSKSRGYQGQPSTFTQQLSSKSGPSHSAVAAASSNGVPHKKGLSMGDLLPCHRNDR